MSIFTNYDLTPENYVPNNLHDTCKPYMRPKLPLVAYNALNEPAGYTWNYGDTVYLEFNTTGNVVYEDQDSKPTGFSESAADYLKGKKFQVLVYNFRYNLVAQCETEAAETVRVLSDSFYPSSLVPGTYTLQLNLIDEESRTHLRLFEDMIYIK